MDGFFTCIIRRCQKGLWCYSLWEHDRFTTLQIKYPFTLFPMERCKKSSCWANCQTLTCLTVMETWSSCLQKMYEDFCQAMEDQESGITHHEEGLKAMSHDARFSVLECAHFRNIYSRNSASHSQLSLPWPKATPWNKSKKPKKTNLLTEASKGC